MRRGCLVLLLSAAACSGDGDDISAPDARPGDPDVRVGAFAVDLIAAEGATAARTSVIGTVHDLATPELLQWDVTQTSGACKLLMKRVPFCATPCGTSAACVADGVCQPNATAQAVGTVHVTGVGVVGGNADFTMTPVQGSYQPVGIALSYPPFGTGDPVRFAADGSAFTAAFAIDGSGIDPLALTSSDPDLARDTAIALTWTAPASSTATIVVKLDISHHAGTFAKIECSAPDNGALTITGPMITGLLDLGAAGFPSIIVTRISTSSTVISAGRVDLELQSQVQRPVTVPGVQSCDGDEDCTPPQTCRNDLSCG